MSGYSRHDPGHDPYIDYAAQSGDHPEERVYGSHHPGLQQVGAPGLDSLQSGTHHQQQHHQQQQQQQQQHHQVLLDPHGMAHHQSPQYGGGQQIRGYMGAPIQQQSTIGKRPRAHDEMGLGVVGVQEGHMHREMQSMASQMPQQTLGGYGGPPQAYHSHPLPNQGPRGSKMPRLGEPPEMMSQAAPSVVGTAGMPPPAPRPRGPKLKFTPEDDQLLVDLKENKALTWKQIADFFPGRSSGTLQVRYCTKLKAKTTQWTDETVQKLRTAVHDYEQEKWRIVAQKVGTGFTSAACKDKWIELTQSSESPENIPGDVEY